MKNKYIFVVLSIVILGITSCTIVRPGEIGFKQHLGTIRGKNIESGVKFYNPFVTKVIKMNTRTVEIFDKLPLPTKEGLSVVAEISLLYHINPDSATSIYKKFGTNYQKVIVLSNFWATAREISARYSAKELYATERIKIEASMLDELSRSIAPHGFIVDAILLKDIDLPEQMAKAIQDKVNAEQAVLQMEFVIQKQHKEAERLIIEAEGIKKSQEIINATLTENQLKYNQIEMLKSLVNSPNTKIIITDAKNPQVMIPNP